MNFYYISKDCDVDIIYTGILLLIFVQCFICLVIINGLRVCNTHFNIYNNYYILYSLYNYAALYNYNSNSSYTPKGSL